jgi:hypothetical protein
MLLRLNPADDEEAGEQRGHQLAEICPHRGMGPEESGLSQKFKHGRFYSACGLTPCTTAFRSISSTDTYPPSCIHCMASAVR